MNLHKLLMGDRWSELPAQSMLDLKVSKIIGITLLSSMALNVAQAHMTAYYIKKSKKETPK